MIEALKRLWNKPPEEPQKVVEVVITNAVALDPYKVYLIIMDKAAITPDEGRHVLEALREEGIKQGVGMMINGDPTTAVQIIEDHPKTP